MWIAILLVVVTAPSHGSKQHHIIPKTHSIFTYIYSHCSRARQSFLRLAFLKLQLD